MTLQLLYMYPIIWDLSDSRLKYYYVLNFVLLFCVLTVV
jgi:hypothetical protein